MAFHKFVSTLIGELPLQHPLESDFYLSLWSTGNPREDLSPKVLRFSKMKAISTCSTHVTGDCWYLERRRLFSYKLRMDPKIPSTHEVFIKDIDFYHCHHYWPVTRVRFPTPGVTTSNNQNPGPVTEYSCSLSLFYMVFVTTRTSSSPVRIRYDTPRFDEEEEGECTDKRMHQKLDCFIKIRTWRPVKRNR